MSCKRSLCLKERAFLHASTLHRKEDVFQLVSAYPWLVVVWILDRRCCLCSFVSGGIYEDSRPGSDPADQYGWQLPQPTLVGCPLRPALYRRSIAARRLD